MKKIVLLSSVTAFILSTNALSNTSLDEVLVTTATKTEKNIDGVSASVIVITSDDIEKIIAQKQKEMESAAKNLDFIKAAKLGDEIAALKG